MSEFFSSQFKTLVPYTPGEQPQDKKYIKLNTNESPFPPAPGVLSVVNSSEAADLRLYSDPELKPLKAAIAENFGLTPGQVFVGNGSDEALNFAFMAFGEDGIAFPNITYGFYKVFAGINHIEMDVKPLRPDFTICCADYENAGKAVVIANPNAPTGISIPLSAIERICETNKEHVVIIDEAYADFAEKPVSAVSLLSRYPNLLIVQTFSKSRSLAGGRVGFALGSEALINDLETIKFSTNPYNVNRLSMAAAVEAMKDRAYFEMNCEKIRETRAWTTKALEELGFHVLPSDANFVFAESKGIPGKALYLKLKDNGILVRHFDDPKITNFNRITIGTRKDMEALVRTIKELYS